MLNSSNGIIVKYLFIRTLHIKNVRLWCRYLGENQKTSLLTYLSLLHPNNISKNKHFHTKADKMCLELSSGFLCMANVCVGGYTIGCVNKVSRSHYPHGDPCPNIASCSVHCLLVETIIPSFVCLAILFLLH